MTNTERNLLIAGLLVWWFWPKRTEETTVQFPNENVDKICPGGWVVPYTVPCPPYSQSEPLPPYAMS